MTCAGVYRDGCIGRLALIVHRSAIYISTGAIAIALIQVPKQLELQFFGINFLIFIAIFSGDWNRLCVHAGIDHQASQDRTREKEVGDEGEFS